VADCQHLARNIAGGGTWTVTSAGAQHQLAQYGTCAFGIQGDKSINTAYVGNQDIIDVINTSIAKFQWEGKIGAKAEGDYGYSPHDLGHLSQLSSSDDHSPEVGQ
jgi:hypothetical protein